MDWGVIAHHMCDDDQSLRHRPSVEPGGHEFDYLSLSVRDSGREMELVPGTYQ